MSIHKELPLLLTVSNNSLKVAFLKKNLKNDYNLLFAATEEEAIAILKSTDVTGILIDGKNSAIYPFVLCKKIRSLSSYRSIPVMLITATLKKQYTQTALQAGFSDFVNEPLEKEEVNQRLTVAFSRMQVRKKIASLTPHITKTAKPIKTSKVSLALRMRRLIKGDFFSELTKVHAISTPFCLFLIEIDDFSKIIKDKGKTTADELVEKLAAFIRQHLRSKDLLFPQGDNCFLAILPKTSLSAGRTMAEMLREEISNQVFSAGNAIAAATISVGLVHYSDKKGNAEAPSSAFEHLIASAVRALQLARKTGNRTIADEARSYELSI